MTLDYPDYQASANQQSAVLASSASFSLSTALQTITTVEVGNWQYVVFLIYGQPSNSAHYVIDNLTASGLLVGQQMFEVRAVSFGAIYPIVVPALGAQVRISGQRAAGAASTLQYEIYGTNIPYESPANNGPTLASGASGSLATNGSFTVNLDNYTGYATVWASSTQTHFNMRIRGSDITGTIVTRTLYDEPSLAEASVTGVWIPALLNDITVTNLNAAAATITVAVTPQLRQPFST